MQHYIKDSNYGPDQEKLPIDFDPTKHATCEEAAKAFFEALKGTVTLYGQDPNVECGIFNPDQAVQRGYGKTWVVWWEAGPWEWAIPASMEFMFNRKAECGWFTEPHHSFDLCFTE